MERGGYCCRDVVPFAAMVSAEGMYVVVNTLFKAATLRGMSYHIFMLYSYATAALLLLPFPFFSHRSTELPPLNLSILCKICLLTLAGFASQTMGYTGLIYSSPTLSSAMSNLMPAFTIILAIIFRMEKFALRSSSSQAKVLGTIESIAGALVVILYQGPPLISILSQTPSSNNNNNIASLYDNHLDQYSLGSSSQSSWIIGGLFLTTQYLLTTIWLIILKQILTEYPAELTILFFYNFFVSVLSAIVALFTEPNSSAWKIRLDIALASVLCSAIFSSVLNNVVHAMIVRWKGPLYVAMFKPISIVIAVVMGVMFLGDDTLYLGSVVGGIVISVGFYTVMWGKAREDMGERCETGDQKVPLLQSSSNSQEI